MEIVVYSSGNCGYCHQQKAFLHENGLEFEERDIAKKEYFQELKSLGGAGTPFTLIQDGEEIIFKVSGFNKAELIKILITKQGELNMEKNHNEENTTVNEVEAKAGVSVTLKPGERSVDSARIDLDRGFARVIAKHNGTAGGLVVELLNRTFVENTISSWNLLPGESLDTSYVSIPKNDTYYLRLSTYYGNVKATASVGPSTIIA